MVEVEEELRAIEDRRRSLLVEMKTLRQKTEFQQLPLPTAVPRSSDEKVGLFLSLFAARHSVYPRLWENPKSGVGRAIHRHVAMSGVGESAKSLG